MKLSNSTAPRPTGHATGRIGTVGPLAAAAWLLAGCGTGDGGSADNQPDMVTVSRADLRIAVREQGEIRAKRETQVRSEVEGRAAILYLIPEGSSVEKGEKLVELDAASLQDREANQAITVGRAKANLVNAEQNLEILEKELGAILASAKSKLEIAELGLEKYLGRLPSLAEHPDGMAAARGDRDGTNREMLARLRDLVEGTDRTDLPNAVVELLGEENLDRDMGDMAQKVLDNIDRIRLARADLKLKEDTLDHSKRLAAKDFITRNELDRHQLDFDSQKSRVTLSWQELDLLIHYGLKSEKIDLELKVDNARIELDKTFASNAARRLREAEEKNSSQQEYDLANGRLENYREQIRNAVIYAPTPGLVVYAKIGDRRSSEIVEEGMEVRERQTLIILPDTSTMIAELKVPEAEIDKVVRGQKATVIVDAFNERPFPATVTRVSPLPDSGSRWSNNNKKVYKSEVTLDGANELLRPGMAATVEILVGVIRDVLTVPLPAVRRQGAVHYVWRAPAGGGDPEPVRVEIGRSNVSHVEIVSGVNEGDRLYLGPPAGANAPEYEQPERKIDQGSDLEGGMSAEEAKAAARKRREAETANRDKERRSEGGGQGGGSASMSGFTALLKRKLPQFATELEGGPRAIFGNQQIKDAIQADPELKEKWDAMMANFRGGRGGGRRGGGESARRNG